MTDMWTTAEGPTRAGAATLGRRAVPPRPALLKPSGLTVPVHNCKLSKQTDKVSFLQQLLTNGPVWPRAGLALKRSSSSTVSSHSEGQGRARPLWVPDNSRAAHIQRDKTRRRLEHP